jgi:hypothetical protein
MEDVRVLLETMFNREEEIVKLLIDCLYDVGSVNMINQRVHAPWLNQLAQWAARCSKPVFRILALRWFKRNCPELIRNWLYTKVKFEPKQLEQVVKTAEAVSSADASQPLLAAQNTAMPALQPVELELYRREVGLLHSRVKLLTTLLIGITVTLGGSLIWSLNRNQLQTSHLNASTPIGITAHKKLCASMLQSCP